MRVRVRSSELVFCEGCFDLSQRKPAKAQQFATFCALGGQFDPIFPDNSTQFDP